MSVEHSESHTMSHKTACAGQFWANWQFLKTVAEILAGAVFENGASDRALRGLCRDPTDIQFYPKMLMRGGGCFESRRLQIPHVHDALAFTSPSIEPTYLCLKAALGSLALIHLAPHSGKDWSPSTKY